MTKQLFQECATDWTLFGFKGGTLTGDYKKTLDQYREEARERFEMLINSPLLVADLAETLDQLATDHQSIMNNQNEVRLFPIMRQVYANLFLDLEHIETFACS